MPQKRIYLNNLSGILTNNTTITNFINWAVGKGFTTFMYYDLNSYLQSNAGSNWNVNTARAVILGDFIAQARAAGVPSHVAVVSEERAFDPNPSNWYPYWETEDYLGTYSLRYGGNSRGFGGHKTVNSFNNYMLSLSPSNLNKTFISLQGPFGTTDFSGLNLELEYWWDHMLAGTDIQIRTTAGSNLVTLLGGATTTNPATMVVNMPVWSTAIPAGSRIVSLNSATQITISSNALSTSPTGGVLAIFGSPVYPNGATRYGYTKFLGSNSLDNEKVANFQVWWQVCDMHKYWALNGRNGKNSAYCGWWLPAGTELSQCAKIVRYMDSLDLHVYRAPTAGNGMSLTAYGQDMFNFVRGRLDYLAQAQNAYNPSGQFKIHFIYSMEAGFSGNWMIANPSVTFDALHNAVVAGFNSWTNPLKSKLLIDGYTIFHQQLARTVRP